jgi:succinate-acetate transporter protein
LKLTAARLDVLVWSFIYGGLIAAVVGLALARNGETYGIGVVVAGAVLVAIGAVLVWIRSRLIEP